MLALIAAALGMPAAAGGDADEEYVTRFEHTVRSADVLCVGTLAGTYEEEIPIDGDTPQGQELVDITAKDLTSGTACTQMNARITVMQALAGPVAIGSTLKVRMALAGLTTHPAAADSPLEKERALLLSRFGFPIGPDQGSLFALRLHPDGISFTPLFLDPPPVQEAARIRDRLLKSVAALCKKDAETLIPRALDDEEILARLHAKVKTVGPRRYELTYDFSSPDQLKDWRVVNEGGKWLINRGKLVQESDIHTSEEYMATLLVTRVGFKGDVEAEVKVQPVDVDSFSVHIAYYCRKQSYMFLMNGSDGFWMVRRVIGGRLPWGPSYGPGDWLWKGFSMQYDPNAIYTIDMGRKQNALFVYLNGKRIVEREDTALLDGAVALGCDAQKGITYGSVKITGSFNGQWSLQDPPEPIAKHPPVRRRRPEKR